MPSPSDIAAVVGRGALQVFRGGVVGPDVLDPAELRRVGASLDSLREGLVGERGLVGRPYLAERGLADAYLLYHAPLSAAKVAGLLGRLRVPEGRPVRVLDIGAGPGGMAVAAALVLAGRGRPARVLATDARSEALRVAEGLATACGVGALTTSVWKLPGPIPEAVRGGGSYDWILAGNVVNELFASDDDHVARRVAWLSQVVSGLLARGGRLVVVEPALRETSRDLLEVRDRLIGAGLRVLAPCLHQAACPALARPRDWCHHAPVWEPSPLAAQLAERAGTDDRRLVFSYLVLARAADTSDEAISDSRFRIVSAPMVEKGKLVVWGCGPAGRERIVRQDRARTPANAAFDDLDRGDVAELAPLGRKGDGLRVEAETDVRVLPPDEAE